MRTVAITFLLVHSVCCLFKEGRRDTNITISIILEVLAPFSTTGIGFVGPMLLLEITKLKINRLHQVKKNRGKQKEKGKRERKEDRGPVCGDKNRDR